MEKFYGASSYGQEIIYSSAPRHGSKHTGNFGISQALGQVPSKHPWQTQSWWEGSRLVELITAKNSPYRTFFTSRLSPERLNWELKKKNNLPTTLLRKEKQRKQPQEKQMCIITFFSVLSLQNIWAGFKWIVNKWTSNWINMSIT